MNCVRYNSSHTVCNGWERGKQKYKCNDCGKQFYETASSFFHKHRIPVRVLVVVIFFHLFVPAGIVKVFVYFLFGCSVSEVTICFWSRKFLDRVPDVQMRSKIGKKSFSRIRHTDEKQIRIRGEKAWWWNTVDEEGNPMTSMITIKRDIKSAKQHMKKHKTIEKDIDVIVTDGLQSYHKSVKVFGRKCYHAITGLKEKTFNIKKRLFFLSNLPAERLHSLIDAYIWLKVRGNFSSIEQAEHIHKAFMLTRLLQKEMALHKLGTFSTALKAHTQTMELTVPITT